MTIGKEKVEARDLSLVQPLTYVQTNTTITTSLRIISENPTKTSFLSASTQTASQDRGRIEK